MPLARAHDCTTSGTGLPCSCCNQRANKPSRRNKFAPVVCMLCACTYLKGVTVSYMHAFDNTSPIWPIRKLLLLLRQAQPSSPNNNSAQKHWMQQRSYSAGVGPKRRAGNSYALRECGPTAWPAAGTHPVNNVEYVFNKPLYGVQADPSQQTTQHRKMGKEGRAA